MIEIAYEKPQDKKLPLSVACIREMIKTFNQNVKELVEEHDIVPSDLIHQKFNQEKNKICKKHGVQNIPSKKVINMCYVEYVNDNLIEPDGLFDTMTTNVSSRGGSGVLEVTTGLEGLENSCKYDCAFCPDVSKKNGAKEDIARSYLPNEGVFKAGLRENFDPFRLIIHRLVELEMLGHVVDKIEWIIIGGTFHSYPEPYLDHYFEQGWRGFNLYKHFSGRFQGKYSQIIKKWVLSGGLQRTLLEIPEWDQILIELDDIYPAYGETDIDRMLTYQQDNEIIDCAHCVGLSIETRPDEISRKSLARLRLYGCTRIQLGVQHLSTKILKINERRHLSKAVEKAWELALNAGFKLDAHFMLDLPGSSPIQDLQYLETVFCGDKYQSDYCKIYFCLNLPYTKIRQWYNRDKSWSTELSNDEKDFIHSQMTDPDVSYEQLMDSTNGNFIWRPYAESDPESFRMVSEVALSMIPPWTRCVRVQRDFCQDTVSTPGTILAETTTNNDELGYVSATIRTNENQMIMQRLEAKGEKIYEIRSREIKNNLIADLYDGNLKLVVNRYRSSNGTEYYISLEYLKNKIVPEYDYQIYDSFTLGHVRLRIPDKNKRTNLEDVYVNKDTQPALIRELHVYGTVKGVKDVKAQQYSGGQGQGFGTMLMYEAERIAYLNDCNYIVVISGVGVRGFYRRLGYHLSPNNYYMVKYGHHTIPNIFDMTSIGDNIYYRTITQKKYNSYTYYYILLSIIVAVIVYYIW